MFALPLGLTRPQIIGKTTVIEGQILKLACVTESAPPALVFWTEVGSHAKLVTGMQRATLIIQNVTRHHSGQYSCTAVHPKKSLTSVADVSVMMINTCNLCKFVGIDGYLLH